jgi:hypothetical protein
MIPARKDTPNLASESVNLAGGGWGAPALKCGAIFGRASRALENPPSSRKERGLNGHRPSYCSVSSILSRSVGLNCTVDGGFQLVRFEAEGAGLAFVGDVTVGVDYVHAVGPSGVGGFGGVAEFVEHGGNVDAELADAGSGDIGAFVLGARAGEDDLIFNVALHLPDVAGVRFGDVDDDEFDLILVLRVELVERGNLPAKGRSGVAAEDEDDGALLGGKRGKLD